MAIEEKQRALEFTFVPDNIDGDLKYDITYDESNPVFSLQISTGGNRIDYPLELVVEIVEFLTSKGVVKSNILSKPSPKVGFEPGAFAAHLMKPGSKVGTFASSLLPPKIEKGEETAPSSLSSNIDPLASFDITGNAPATTIDKKKSDTPPIPEIIKSGDTIDSPTPTTETAPVPKSSEMITRPVIRSRVTGGDPQSAEKEAAMLRASSGKGAGKEIRKAHRSEDE